MSICIQYILPMIMMLNPSWTERKAKRYATPICVEAERRDIDPVIGVAIAFHETGFNYRKVYHNRNGSIDYGLMQFNCDKPEKIHLKWRKYWCHPARLKYLMTIEGNIRASFRELYFWKTQCLKKHSTSPFLYYSSTCLDCFDLVSSRLVPINYGILTRKRLHEMLNKRSHWWIRHYNWLRKPYWLSILYIYRTLKLQNKENIKLLRNDYYRRLAKRRLLRRCLKKDDLCLGDYNKWRQRRNLKRKSKD